MIIGTTISPKHTWTECRSIIINIPSGPGVIILYSFVWMFVKSKKILPILNITFIFNKHHYSLAITTLLKYECDSMSLPHAFAQWQECHSQRYINEWCFCNPLPWPEYCPTDDTLMAQIHMVLSSTKITLCMQGHYRSTPHIIKSPMH